MYGIFQSARELFRYFVLVSITDLPFCYAFYKFKHEYTSRNGFLTAVNVNNTVLWDVTSCVSVDKW